MAERKTELCMGSGFFSRISTMASGDSVNFAGDFQEGAGLFRDCQCATDHWTKTRCFRCSISCFQMTDHLFHSGQLRLYHPLFRDPV